MTDSPPALNPSFVARIKGILMRPVSEWEIIRAEHQTIGSLFTGYAVILAAIGPVCAVIAAIAFGKNVVAALSGGLIAFALGLAGVFFLGLVIDLLAPTFGGQRDRLAAMKVAVYASTASWVAGAFQLLPWGLSALALIGTIYTLYLLYLGLPRLMGVAQDKAAGYAVMVVIAAIVIWMIIGGVTGLLMLGFVTTAAVSSALV